MLPDMLLVDEEVLTTTHTRGYGKELNMQKHSRAYEHNCKQLETSKQFEAVQNRETGPQVREPLTRCLRAVLGLLQASRKIDGR